MQRIQGNPEPSPPHSVASTTHDLTSGQRWLAGASLLVPIFYFTPQGDAYRWVDLSRISVLVIVAAAALGITASVHRTKRVAFGAAAGVLCLAGAILEFYNVLQAVPGFTGGNASTWTLLSGLGLGYLVLAFADRIPQAPAE